MLLGVLFFFLQFENANTKCMPDGLVFFLRVLVYFFYDFFLCVEISILKLLESVILKNVGSKVDLNPLGAEDHCEK